MADDGGSHVVPVRRWRVWTVFALAAFLVFGHVYDVTTMTEHWPFSYYPMYGRTVTRPRLQLPALYGVFPDDPAHKNRRRHTKLVRIMLPDFVPQLGEARIRNILIASWGREDRQPSRRAINGTAAILLDYLKLYESRRIAGLHDGPPMLEAQLCRVTWRVSTESRQTDPYRIDQLLGVRADGQVAHYYRHPRTPRPTTAPADAAPTDEARDARND